MFDKKRCIHLFWSKSKSHLKQFDSHFSGCIITLRLGVMLPYNYTFTAKVWWSGFILQGKCQVVCNYTETEKQTTRRVTPKSDMDAAFPNYDDMEQIRSMYRKPSMASLLSSCVVLFLFLNHVPCYEKHNVQGLDLNVF